MHIRFIYNPKSGREKSQQKISSIIKYLFEDGHEVSMRFTKKMGDATNYAIEANEDKIDRLVIVGGDGTVNEVVCGLVKCNSKIPLMIVPGGTTNDFASYMGLVKNDWDTYNTIVSGKIKKVDCGKIDDKYFMNVGACGILTDVAHNTPVGLKTAFGRAAYVMKALTELTPENLKPIMLKIKSDEVSGEYKSLLVLIANSKSVGGFQKMAPQASVSDGFLDVLIVLDMPIPELLGVFMKLKQGEHINHQGVMYFKTKKVSLDSNENVELDVDGEFFGELPATFEIVDKAINLLV